jgi:membrane protein YdbS with pleckstrin-like domain
VPEELFSNTPVDLDRLPDYRDTSLQPVVAAYVRYKVATTLVFWLIVLLAVSVSIHLPFVTIAPGLWPVLIVLAMTLWMVVLTRSDARRRGWALREHDLIYQSGVIWRRTVVLPFARIQHVETSSGPLERWFDLTRLKCFTAGGAASDLTVEGLDQTTAAQVRQYLLEQIREDDQSESEPAVTDE